jgi:hypothetical protein
VRAGSEASDCMKRSMSILRVAFFYALLGLGASIAVAWGLAWSVGYDRSIVWSVRAAHSDVDEERPIRFSLYRQLVIHRCHSIASYRRSLSFRQPPVSSGYDPNDAVQLWGFGLGGDQGIGMNTAEKYIREHRTPGFSWTIGSAESWSHQHNRVWNKDDIGFAVVEDARGFPFLCLWNEWQLQPDNSLTAAGGITLEDRIPVATTLPPALLVRALPYRPIWTGLAANIAFYGLLFYLVVRTWKGLRGWKRFNLGLCPSCAYDLRHDYSRGCSECGRGVRESREYQPRM